MYGIWILAIAFSCAAVVLFVLGLVLRCISENSIKWYKSGSTASNVCVGIAVLFIVCIICICTGGGIGIVVSKAEFMEFEETKAMVETIYESGTDLDNIGVTQTIIEKNQWLARVRASKEIYGVFSQYYYIDADNIEPIMIRGRV